MLNLLRRSLIFSLGLQPVFVAICWAQPIVENQNVTQTDVFELAPEQFFINGGKLSRDGQNLFHGFDSFNLDANQAAIFLNSPNAANIFSKISGGKASVLDGFIGVAQGNPNLYFLNPAGIIFGENAQLNVPNAFVATTATALGFEGGWLNVVGNSDFANLVGEPSKFAFNTGGTVGDIVVQGNLDLPAGNLGLVGGRIQGDRRISSPEDLVITTAVNQDVIQLRQPGNLLSLELNKNALKLGNPLDFSVNQLPRLLTGSGDIQLSEISAKYGIIATDSQLTLNNTQIQTAGHLALLGQGITTNQTSSASGLNQLLISGELAESYQTQKPFLEAIANKINFAIEADPIDGTPIIVTDSFIDNIPAETLNAADIRLENSQFTGQNIYVLGNNIDLISSQFTSTDNLSFFALDSVILQDVSNTALQLSSGGSTSIRGSEKITANSLLNLDSQISSQGDLFLSSGDIQLRESRFNSQGGFLLNADNILLQNSQLSSGQDLIVNAKGSLILEDIADSQRGENFTSKQPLQLIAGNNLLLSSGDILRAIAPKNDSLFQAGKNITVSTEGEQIELLGNFNSGGNIKIGNNSTSDVIIEGGRWQADGEILLSAQDELILQDFHKSVFDNYGEFDSPLNISGGKIDFVADNLVEIYLGNNSSISSTQNLTIGSLNQIKVTGSLSSENSINLTADIIDLGYNLERLDGSPFISTFLVPSDFTQDDLDSGAAIFEATYFGGNLTAGADINLQAGDRLRLADFEGKPLNLAGENINLTAQNSILLDIRNDPFSEIVANKDIMLTSANAIGKSSAIISGGFSYKAGQAVFDAKENILFDSPNVFLQGSQITAGESITFDGENSIQLEGYQSLSDFDLINSLNDISVESFVAIAPTINISPSNDIRIDLFSDSGKIETNSDLDLTSFGNIYLSGNIITAGNLSVNAFDSIDLIQPQFDVGGDLFVVASNSLEITDILPVPSATNYDYRPIRLDAGGSITLQAENGIDIPSYDARSLVTSGGDINLISNTGVLSNIRYEAGNDFSIKDLNGNPTSWLSNVNVNNTSEPLLSVYLKDGQFLPIGQMNLSQVYAEGSIEFGDFTGRSLILEAGETIRANSIFLNVPVAFGYSDEEPAVRVRNIPDTLLSLTGGENLMTSAQSILIGDPTIPFNLIFIGAELPAERDVNGTPLFGLSDAIFASETAAIESSVQINDLSSPIPLVPPIFFYATGADGTFISSVTFFGGDGPGQFSFSPTSPRLLVSGATGANVGSLNVNLTAIDNPLDGTNNATVSPVSGVRGTSFGQDLIDQSNSEMAAIAPEDNESGDTRLRVTGACSNGDAEDETAQSLVEVLACEQENLRLARLEQNIAQQLESLAKLGFLYYTNNQYLEALTVYQDRLTLAQTTENVIAEVESLQGITQLYGALGNYEEAQRTNRQSLEKLGDVSVSDPKELLGLQQAIANNAGFLAYAAGAYNIAVERYELSLDLAKQTNNIPAEIEALTQLGLSYYQQTDYQSAKATQTAALTLAKNIGSLPNELKAYEGLAIAEYALENYDQAIDYFKAALALAEQTGDRHAQARQWSALGDAQYKAQQNTASIDSLSNAIQLWEGLRQDLGQQDLFRVSLFETQETTYSTLQEVLLETNQFARALEINERGRSRAFVELLERGLSPQADQQEIESPNIDQMRQVAAAQQATLVSYAIGREVIERNGQREIIDTEIWIWVVQPDGTVEFRRQDMQVLANYGVTVEALVSGVRCFGDRQCLVSTLARQRNRGLLRSMQTSQTSDPNLKELHRLLIAPIADLLPSDPTDEVIFIPHRSLFLVPFAALQDSTGRYLIQDHTIRTAPSIQVLDLTRQQRQQVTGEGITIVGNPTMPGNLKQLPGTATEAQAIADMFDTEFITGNDATPTLVTQTFENSRFIHLATHGLLDGYGDDAAKIPGAIALAPTEADDGFLTASEIMQLRLNAEMVVLSACDTGRGDITEDGVIGLSRSFMGAGVPSVVVSLWQVPDESTSDLMIEFYEQLQQNPNKAQALRQAMLTNLEKYPQPRDWAAFTLMGET